MDGCDSGVELVKLCSREETFFSSVFPDHISSCDWTVSPDCSDMLSVRWSVSLNGVLFSGCFLKSEN